MTAGGNQAAGCLAGMSGAACCWSPHIGAPAPHLHPPAGTQRDQIVNPMVSHHCSCSQRLPTARTVWTQHFSHGAPGSTPHPLCSSHTGHRAFARAFLASWNTSALLPFPMLIPHHSVLLSCVLLLLCTFSIWQVDIPNSGLLHLPH